MHHQDLIFELDKNHSAFEAVLSIASEELTRWKPDPDKWSLLEIVCHLYDEEREDFRFRLQSTLENPEKAFPAIDPPAWVTERKYAAQDYGEMLKKFLEERGKSIQWLRSLQHPDWQRAHNHPKFGEMTADMFLHNWVTHDYLHMRQIIKLKFDFIQAHSETRFDYAGNW